MVWLDIRLGRLVRGYVGGYVGRLVVGWWAARVKTEEIEDKQD